jgi:hypothetical protein
MFRRRSLALSLVAVLMAALGVSLLEGLPERLPGVALGSAVLLHIERATAAFALAVALLSVLAQATRGHLPTQLTTAGLSYGADAAAASAVTDLQDQVERLERDLTTVTELVLAVGEGRG